MLAAISYNILFVTSFKVIKYIIENRCHSDKFAAI